MTDVTIGIDISKDTLDAHRLQGAGGAGHGIGDERRQFPNTAAGHKALIRWIGAMPARVVYEPTGHYHRKLEVKLAAAAMPIVKVNPRQARRFAQAIGQHAKTDRLDRFPIMLKHDRAKYRSRFKHLSGSFTIRLSKPDRTPL
jgi:transposase